MKLIIDIPDEVYDTIQNKTLNLTSDARSNGKHLVYELIGCVLNGTVLERETDCNCSICKHEFERDGSNCYECVKGIKNRYSPKETIEIKYGEKNLIK